MLVKQSLYHRVYWFTDGSRQELGSIDLGAISPDGGLIALVKKHQHRYLPIISIMRLEGKKFTQFVKIVCQCDPLELESIAWSPDGCFLAIGLSTEVIS